MTALLSDNPPSPLKTDASVIDKTRHFTLVRRKLDELATWKPEELYVEFRSWTPGEILALWGILENTFRCMCSAYGLASARVQLSGRGIQTNMQIKRLFVLQQFVQDAEEMIV